MDSRTRVLKTLNFETPDRVPFNFWMDRRLLTQYEQKHGEFFRVRHYGGDCVECFPLLGWPTGKTKYADGSVWVTEPFLKDMADYKSVKFPSVKDAGVFDHILKNIKECPDKAKLVNICGPTTILHNVRLLENIYYDIYDYPEELLYLCREVMRVQTDVIRECVKMDDVDIIYFQEDICSSGGAIFSQDTLDTFIFDTFSEGIELAKAHGKKLIYHSDGNVTPMLDKLCALGFDAVNPMQIEFNDFAAYKKKFDGRMGVYGGIDNTKIIPTGSEAEIRSHIRYIFDTLGAGGGLIMSSHDINFDTPEKNIDCMVDEIMQCVYLR